jgi:NAD+ kinase
MGSAQCATSAQRDDVRLTMSVPARIGLVVHPTRAIEEPLNELRRWAAEHDAELVQVHGFAEQQRIAHEGKAEDCDLLVSIGGDGTALAAIRAGLESRRPVLAVGCGSLGVLTAVDADGVVQAVDRFSEGDWTPWSLPTLQVELDSGTQLLALNDVAVIRAGSGQLRVVVEVDGNTFARIAGDGCIVSTPVGSSAYSLAAHGALLAPDIGAYLLTPLPTHGGSCPPLVVGAASVIRLVPTPGHGGARLELDGQLAEVPIEPLTISFRPEAATVVAFQEQESFLAVLRKRAIITDSPRILAEDARDGA